MEKDLFSVILLHYNQPDYVTAAIDSVLAQDYARIELIFADDASTAIDLDGIKRYIEKNKGANIEKVTYVINGENRGTVKTINRAVKAAEGKHLLFFAADDALFGKEVVSNFVKAFEAAADNVYMISAQCYMMDKEMKSRISRFVDRSAGEAFNKMSAGEQFAVFTGDCFLAIGATAMRTDMFERFGYFNEQYKFVEDWSYYLHLTRSGGLIRYADFNALLHRDGGISHYAAEGNLPEHVLRYKLDMITIFENEIFAKKTSLSPLEKTKIFLRYEAEKRSYAAGGGKEVPRGIGLVNTVYMRLLCGFFGLGQKGWRALKGAMSLSGYLLLLFVAAVLSETVYPGVIPGFVLRTLQIISAASAAVTVLIFALSVLMKAARMLKRRLHR